MYTPFQVPVIKHRTYINASLHRVYQTLTTGEGWDAWFTQGTTVDPVPGGEIRLRWKNFGPQQITLEDGGPILAAEKDSRLTFQWSPSDGFTTVDISLEKRGEGVLLHLAETGYTLSKKDLEACIECATGWGEALTLLKVYLEHGITYGEVPFEKAAGPLT